MAEGLSVHPPYIRIDRTPDQLSEDFGLAFSGRESLEPGAFDKVLDQVTFSGRDTISGIVIAMSGTGRLVSVSLPDVSEQDSAESLAVSLGDLATSLLGVQRTAVAKSASLLTSFEGGNQ